MVQTIKQQQQELIEKLQQRQEELLKKFDAEGYVVAGYGGDTYYCFVGTGRGASPTPLKNKAIWIRTLARSLTIVTSCVSL